jgi:K+-transporting ATPase ATPase C chain
MMLKQTLIAARTLLILTILTGVIYPLAVTLVAQGLFPAQANGSLLVVDGVTVGSALIGQAGDEARYLWPRPSAVDYLRGTSPDTPRSSGASNQGSISATLAEDVNRRAADFRAAHALADDIDVPPDMLFASGSGLDPHISPDAARLQIDRVASARGINRESVAALVADHIESPQFGFLGQPRVNVLLLNLALDAAQTGLQ